MAHYRHYEKVEEKDPRFLAEDYCKFSSSFCKSARNCYGECGCKWATQISKKDDTK